MRELFEKMIDESMAAQRADIDTIKKKKRGTDFKIKDAEPYVKVASKMGLLIIRLKVCLIYM